MTALVYAVLEKLVDKLDVATVRTFFRVFRSLVLILIPLCLVISGLLFYQMFTQVRNGQQMLTDAIVARYESTSETYKALEALVLSGLDKESNLEKIAVSDDTDKAVAALSAPQPNPKQLKILPKAKPDNPDVAYLVVEGGRNFIMATSRALPDDFDASQSGALESAFVRDPTLKKALDGLIALDDKLCQFNGKPLADGLGPVVQTYVISEKNIIALCGADEARNPDYENHYDADRDFIGRPYYRDTMATSKPPSQSNSKQMNQYFHVTPSYIDTAGSGFTRSYCRDITLPPSKRRNAMICFDATTPAAAARRLTTDKMRTFSGDVAIAGCNLSGCSVVDHGPFELVESLSPSIARWLFPVDAELHVVAEDTLTKEYKLHTKDLEQISGRLRVLSTSGNAETVSFSIPFGKGENDVSAFLLCEIRLGMFEQSSFRKGIWAGGCLIVALMLLVGSFVETGLRLEQQVQIKQRLSELMGRVPVAYCYCDEADMIRFINPSFAHLLGYRNAVLALEKLYGKAFEKLLFGDKDVVVYERIKRQREKGTLAQVYDVHLSRGEEAVAVKVFSTSLPSAISSKKTGPETFGLFLPQGSPLLHDYGSEH
jgi:PAS domain S-box-containing protein